MSFCFRVTLLATATLAAALPATADAAAFYLQEQSVKAAGRAFSGEVADTGAASLWWNPASIAGMTGGEAYLGAAAILPKGDVRNNGTRIVRPGQAPAPVGGNPIANDPIDKGVLPSGAIAHALGDRLAVGLAITSPYSFTTNYAVDSWARYTADKTKLRTIDIQPSIALAATDWLRVGGAINVEYADASLSNALPNLSPLLADGHQTLKGNGWDIGWSAGAQLHNDIVTVGVAYKSSIKHVLEGSVITTGLLGPLAVQNRTIDTKATFRTPWQLNVGARGRATDRLTLNGQVTRFGWNEFDAIRLGAPINAALPEVYRNTWSFAGGVDYALSDTLTVRGGVQHDQTPTQNGLRDARVPDSNRWNYALGTSYQITPALTIDAAASYIDFKDASIDRVTAAYAGTAVQTPILVNGTLEKAHAIVLGLGARMTF